MTKYPSIISRISREIIHGWYESSDRWTRSKFPYISISRIWMPLTQTSCPYDMGAYAWSQRKMRDEVSPITPSISCAIALAVTLYPKTRKWTEIWVWECICNLWYYQERIWWYDYGCNWECKNRYSFYRWGYQTASGNWLDQFPCSCYTCFICLLYMYATMAGKICSLACKAFYWLWTRYSLSPASDASGNYGYQYDPHI